jgi:hypothetical protein
MYSCVILESICANLRGKRGGRRTIGKGYTKEE